MLQLMIIFLLMIKLQIFFSVKNFIVKGHNVQQTLQNITTVQFSVSYNEEKQQNLESENVWDDFCSKMT